MSASATVLAFGWSLIAQTLAIDLSTETLSRSRWAATRRARSHGPTAAPPTENVVGGRMLAGGYGLLGAVSAAVVLAGFFF